MRSPLQTPSSRLELPIRSKPHKLSLHRGLTLGYRRVKSGAGSWIAIVADGKGNQPERFLADADDQQKANGQTVLDFKQARTAACKYEVEYKNNDCLAVDEAPTVDEALSAYAADLKTRGQFIVNAQMPRAHLTKTLLTQRMDRLQPKQLKDWRDGLIVAGMKPSTCNRITKPLVAAFNLAIQLQPRLATNAEAWKVGLKALPDATNAREAVLLEHQVRAVVAECYSISQEFGLYVQTHAETGARSSQIRRLTVGSLQLTGGRPRVMMPADRKGRGDTSKRAPTPIAVGADLARGLTAAAGDRPALDPALLRSNGRPWTNSQEHGDLFEKAARAAKLPVGTTIYALRHSSIVHALLKGTPASVVAQWHRTSLAEMARHYAKYMQDHHDDIVRNALPNYGPGHNIVQIKACA